MSTPKEILKQYWGYEAFRPMQEDIINTVLAGEDVLALLPTGGGKSLCFQVPALAKEGICLVVSPLIALMKDQVANLEKKGIPALSIHSGMPFMEVRKTLQNAAYGPFKFLYLSPERLQTKLFQEWLPALHVNLIAVDEAHCISQWGYDFRPPYLRIAELRAQLPSVPVLALTASATDLVQKDICEKLAFNRFRVFRQSFEKPNLSFSIFEVDSKINKLVQVLNAVPGCGIVYCKSRRKTKDVAELLRLHHIAADFYHAGLTNEERAQKQQAWIDNKTRIMVCTNAFGMGIDKPDVRTVVHMDVPDCVENYYQEAGRAGRDGLKAYAVLLYKQADISNLQLLPDSKYPLMIDIRKVYGALGNFLQIETGSGEFLSYEFDLNLFIKNFQLDAVQTVNVLKVLEQEELLIFNEQVFIPAKICFTTNKDTLNEFEKLHPEFDDLIKALLRNYQGIFDSYINVNERTIATFVKTSIVNITEQLNQLTRYSILDFQPQKDKPQIFFQHNRVRQQDLLMDQKRYAERKEIYKRRVQAMIAYTTGTVCRSLFVGNYFGDDQMKNCGICDVCLANKGKAVISSADFEEIKIKLLNELDSKDLTAKELQQQLKQVSKEKLYAVINWLIKEEIIEVQRNGALTQKKNS